jgi:hypothetical protein
MFSLLRTIKDIQQTCPSWLAILALSAAQDGEDEYE